MTLVELTSELVGSRLSVRELLQLMNSIIKLIKDAKK